MPNALLCLQLYTVAAIMQCVHGHKANSAGGRGIFPVPDPVIFRHNILQVIRMECASLCEKRRPSLLRKCTKEKLTSFTWTSFHRELQDRAPTLLSILKCAARPRRSRSDPSLPGIGLAAAVLLKQRNKELNLVQSIVAVMLYAGHSAKKVCFYILCYLY